MKINFNNAEERIAAKLERFERKQREDDIYYEMPEADFDRVVKEILDESTKEFHYALSNHTYKYEIAWLGNAPGGRISTYKHKYAFVKFI